MPIYGFECKSCRNLFETLVRSGDKVACPSCGSSQLEQQLSRIAKPSNGGDADDFACSKGDGGGGHVCGGGGCGLPGGGFG